MQFGYQEPGFFRHRGPITAANLDAAKAEIRRRLGLTRLPPGFKVWDLAKRPMDRYHVVPGGFPPPLSVSM